MGISRRRFLASACGSALTLLTLQGCADEQRANAPRSTTTPPIDTTPGGTFEIPAEATTEPCGFDRADISSAREELALRSVTLGPTTARQARAIMDAHAT